MTKRKRKARSIEVSTERLRNRVCGIEACLRNAHAYLRERRNDRLQLNRDERKAGEKIETNIATYRTNFSQRVPPGSSCIIRTAPSTEAARIISTFANSLSGLFITHLRLDYRHGDFSTDCPAFSPENLKAGCTHQVLWLAFRLIMGEAIKELTAESAFAMREREVDLTSGKARISYLVCEPMEQAGFTNAFSTRMNGVSAFPRDALNLAYFKGDEKENVSENRHRFLQAAGARGAQVVTARQTHSTDRCAIDLIEQARGPQPHCDAMTTKLEGVLLGIQTADCLPVLIADEKSGAMAAIHAGWRGTAGRITERAIADLMQSYGVNPRNCIAALGPAACADCYEVGQDVIKRYKQEFGYWKRLLVNFKEGSKAHLDIRAANRQQLAFCGIAEERIHIADYCTMHQNDLFFSYRREANGQPSNVGRLLSVIGKLS